MRSTEPEPITHGSQVLHMRITKEMNLRLDEAVTRQRRKTGKRVSRAELVRAWLERQLSRDERAWARKMSA